ncbi:MULTISPECIES: hypothetical protein [Clostridium]|uniref:hypothetical protein n=1 Tax=Clostridium TaxID=1485 RepID=UPI000825B965|nr:MULTISPECIES: hypothetical protein [Clostridium]PJI06568.1 hypothetical protein CUB90_01220 [Clostridium sp. CT7]
MISVKKLLGFTPEEKILYERYIRKSQKNNNITFVKVPVFWMDEICDSFNLVKYRLIYSNGIEVKSEIFEIDNSYDVIDYKDTGLSFAVIYKKKTSGIIFENEINQLFKLSFNPHCQWMYFQ